MQLIPLWDQLVNVDVTGLEATYVKNKGLGWGLDSLKLPW